MPTHTQPTIANPVDAASPAGTGAALDLDRILDATAASLAEHGYDGTTIRRIAGRLGCAVGSIYRYCSDKRALLGQVTQRRFEPVAAAVDDHLSIPHTVELYLEAASGEPQQYRLMFWLASLDSDDQPTSAGPATMAGDLHGTMQLPAVITRIMQGWTRQLGDPRAARKLWAQVHGGVTLGLPCQALLEELRPLMTLRSARADDLQDVSSAMHPAPNASLEPTVVIAPSLSTVIGGRSKREDLTLL